MIEKIIKDYLDEQLSVPVYYEVPDDAPQRYVTLEKTGSGKSNHINNATFAIQSWAESTYEAAELNELVKEAMDDIVVLDEISRSALNSDYNFTDVTTKRHRYQAVYDLVFY